MKEIMAIIRMNMVNPTKTALANAGFPAFSCRKCLGRGKKSIDAALAETILETGEQPDKPVAEHLTEYSRLIAKRLFTIIVDDEQVDEAVKIIIDTKPNRQSRRRKDFRFADYGSLHGQDRRI